MSSEPGSSICPKPLILSRACAAGATARLVEQNVRYEAAQGINGSVPLKQSPRSAASPKPQVPPKPIHLQKATYQTPRHKALTNQKPRMEEETPAAVSSVTKEKSSKVSDLINRFEGGSSLNPSDFKKDPSVLHITKSQGRYGSTPSPQPKLPSQHSLQTQGTSNTDRTQVAQLPTANGVSAQEEEERRSPERGSAASTPLPAGATDSSLTNGEGESTHTESLPSVASCEEQMLNSCHRTPDRKSVV